MQILLGPAEKWGFVFPPLYKILWCKNILKFLEQGVDILSVQDLQGLLPVVDETERPVLDRVLQQKIRHARSHGIYP